VRTRSAAAAAQQQQQQRDQHRLWQTPSFFLLRRNILLFTLCCTWIQVAEMDVVALTSLLLLLLLLTTTARLSSAAAEEPYDVRIACGSNQDLYASNGFKWAKDFGYTAGSSANLTVKNTLVPMLNTLRYFQISDGPENCYNISVPVGHYLIRFFIIHFFCSSSTSKNILLLPV
jgi:hypothetical protein